MVLNVLAHFLQLCNNTIDPLLWVRWRVIAFFYNRLLYIDRKKESMAVSRLPSHN